MKIRNIEFDEKTLISVVTKRSLFNSAAGKKGCVQYYVDLFFQLTDDFNFTYIESKRIQYTEFDFEGRNALDIYIKSLEEKLNDIISENGTKDK